MIPAERPLHPWIQANPIQDVKRLERQAFTWNVISKITVVAIAAISFTVLILSFTLGQASQGAAPFILVGLIFSTPFLAHAASKSQAWGKEIEKEAETARLVAQQYKFIKNLTDDQIHGYLFQFGILVPADTPPRLLLPLIARFQVRVKEAQDSKQAADRMLAAEIFNQRDQKLKENEIRHLRLSSRLMGWQKLERESVPAALEAALILQILSQPHSQLKLSQIGSLRPKQFEERQLDRQYGGDDTYFVFKGGLRPPLTLAELIDVDLAPIDLRAKLFPRV